MRRHLFISYSNSFGFVSFPHVDASYCRLGVARCRGNTLDRAKSQNLFFMNPLSLPVIGDTMALALINLSYGE
jgi:hypothetical protein